MFRLVRASTPSDQALLHRHAWPVRYSAFNTSDDSVAKIFVMHARPPGEFVGDSFSCVASVQQMTDLPEDEVGPSSPYFRVSTFDLLCRTAEASEEFDEKIKDAVQELADNTAAAAALSESETTIITPNAV